MRRRRGCRRYATGSRRWSCRPSHSPCAGPRRPASHPAGSPRLLLRAWPLELVNGRAFDPRRVAEEITALRAQVAPDLFLATDATHVPSSSIAAFGLAAAAYRKGDEVGEAVSLALRHAMFE